MLKKIAMTAVVFAVSMSAVSVNIAAADPMMRDHMSMHDRMMMKRQKMMMMDRRRHMMMRHHDMMRHDM